MAKGWSRPFRASPKKAAHLRGGPTASEIADGSGQDTPQVVPVVSKSTIAADLKRIADALPSAPAKGRGRPRKDASVQLSRQQRRYRERMLSKADEALRKVQGVAAQAWDEVTGGAGVVLVDGKPVDAKGGA